MSPQGVGTVMTLLIPDRGQTAEEAQQEAMGDAIGHYNPDAVIVKAVTKTVLGWAVRVQLFKSDKPANPT